MVEVCLIILIWSGLNKNIREFWFEPGSLSTANLCSPLNCCLKQVSQKLQILNLLDSNTLKFYLALFKSIVNFFTS